MNSSFLFLTLFLGFVLASCQSLSNKTESLVLLCGENTPQPEFNYIQIFLPDGTKLDKRSIGLDIYARDASGLRTVGSQTERGCVKIHGLGDFRQLLISAPEYRASMAIDLQLGRVPSAIQLKDIPSLAPGLNCPTRFTNKNLLKEIFRIGNTNNLESMHFQIDALSRVDKTVHTLAVKDFGRGFAEFSNSVDLERLADGDFDLELRVQSISELSFKSEPRLVDTCSMSVVRKLEENVLLKKSKMVFSPRQVVQDVMSSGFTQTYHCIERSREIGCSSVGRCKNLDYFERGPVVAPDDVGRFNLFSYATNPVGEKSGVICQSILVSASAPQVSVFWSEPSLNVKPSILDKPRARFNARVELKHDLLGENSLFENMQCRVEITTSTGRSEGGVSCASGICDGKNLIEYTSCDPEIEFDLTKFWGEAEFKNATFQLFVKVNDGAGNESESVHNFSIIPSRWNVRKLELSDPSGQLVLPRDLQLDTDGSIVWISGDNQLYRTQKNKTFKIWSWGDGSLTKLMRSTEGKIWVQVKESNNARLMPLNFVSNENAGLSVKGEVVEIFESGVLTRDNWVDHSYRFYAEGEETIFNFSNWNDRNCTPGVKFHWNSIEKSLWVKCANTLWDLKGGTRKQKEIEWNGIAPKIADFGFDSKGSVFILTASESGLESKIFIQKKTDLTPIELSFSSSGAKFLDQKGKVWVGLGSALIDGEITNFEDSFPNWENELSFVFEDSQGILYGYSDRSFYRSKSETLIFRNSLFNEFFGVTEDGNWIGRAGGSYQILDFSRSIELQTTSEGGVNRRLYQVRGRSFLRENERISELINGVWQKLNIRCPADVKKSCFYVELGNGLTLEVSTSLKMFKPNEEVLKEVPLGVDVAQLGYFEKQIYLLIKSGGEAGPPEDYVWKIDGNRLDVLDTKWPLFLYALIEDAGEIKVLAEASDSNSKFEFSVFTEAEGKSELTEDPGFFDKPSLKEIEGRGLKGRPFRTLSRDLVWCPSRISEVFLIQPPQFTPHRINLPCERADFVRFQNGLVSSWNPSRDLVVSGSDLTTTQWSDNRRDWIVDEYRNIWWIEDNRLYLKQMKDLDTAAEL